MHAELAHSPAPGPRTRLGNLRRSLAPRPAGARQTSRSRSPPEPLRYPRQIPTLEEKRAGQVRAHGAGPLGRGPPPGPAAWAPGARFLRTSATPEPLFGSALRPPGPAAPPARPAPSVHAPGRALPRARASRPGTLFAPRPTGPGSPRSPGRRRRERVAASARAREPAPDVPGEFGAAPGAPSPPPRAAAAAALKGPVLSRRAAPGGGRGRYLSQRLLGSRCGWWSRARSPCYSFQAAAILPSPPPSLHSCFWRAGLIPKATPTEGVRKNEDSSFFHLVGVGGDTEAAVGREEDWGKKGLTAPF